jgi:hypothetical protein
MTTKFLDLDAVSSDAEFSLKLNGKEHALSEPSVDTFITNMRELETLSLNASPREEIEMSIRMIQRSFPTIPETELRALKLTQLKAIGDFARQASGQDAKSEIASDGAEAGEGAAEGAEGNVVAAS